MSRHLTRNPNLDLVPSVLGPQHSDPWIQNLGRVSLDQMHAKGWWTGANPEHLSCPGLGADGYVRSLPTIDLRYASRAEVLAYFDNTWVLTEILFAGLACEEAFYRPPYHELRHPLIFYYVHPAVLYINKLHIAGLLSHTIDPYLERLFETGVDEMSWDDLSKNEMIWPDLQQCQDYRKKAYALIRDIVQQHPGLAQGHPAITQASPLWALAMGMEHERIHLETSSVLMRELPLHLLRESRFFPPLHPSAKRLNPQQPAPFRAPVAGRDFFSNSWVVVAGGETVIGRKADDRTYGWDNEFGQSQRNVSSFAAQKRPVSNGEYYEFVKDGGYRKEQYWSAAGWEWRSFRNVKAPSFWVPIGAQGTHEYALRTIFAFVEMPWHWPAIVNFYEAQAYASWLSEKQDKPFPLRLMTEAEHYRMRTLENRAWTLGAKQHGYQLDLAWGSEGPVDGDQAKSIHGLFGNVWQWLSDHFHPLEGFQVHSLYEDFSTPCFDGRHQMIVGGSFISTGSEARPEARFHFRPHFFQQAGFRLIDPLSEDNEGACVQLHAHWERDSAYSSQRSPFAWNGQMLKQGFQSMLEQFTPYWDQRDQLSPYGYRDEAALQALLHEPWQEQPEDLAANIRKLLKGLGQAQELVGHPGYFAYVAGAANPVAAIGDALSLLLNPYTGTSDTAKAAVELEEKLIQWLLELVGLPSNGGGWICSGSSLAIYAAVIAARERRKAPVGKRRVYVSDQAHHAISKALFGAGFEAEECRVLASRQGKMDCQELEREIERDKQQGLRPILVIATAGTTNLGKVDPLAAIADIAQRHELWYHIDAAYGGFFRLLPETAILEGLERADSLSLDPHKSLYMPYGTGILLVKQREDLRWPRGFSSTYMKGEGRSGELAHISDYSPELSRDFRGLRLWLSLKTFGQKAYRDELQLKWQLARELCAAIQEISWLEIIAEPELSLFAFAVKGDLSNVQTAALLQWIKASQKFLLSSALVYNRLVIRVCVLSFRNRQPEAQALLQHILAFPRADPCQE